MATISLCMIVKNEEDCLARCLDSVFGIVDEIIIVDTASDDQTLEIAKKYTDKVYHFDWIDNFSAARNFSFSKASCEYCMWLDADDFLTSSDAEKLSALKDTLPHDTDIVMLPYNIAFDRYGNPVFSYYRERIVKNNSLYKWSGRVHEAIVPVGNVIYSNAAITHKKLKPHDANRNLAIYEKMLSENVKFTPRDSFYYGRELYFHKRFDEAISVFNNFLSDENAWTENKIDACRIIAECYLEKDDTLSALSALLRSLIFSDPRAEICCLVGDILIQGNSLSEAVFWYNAALNDNSDLKSGAFINPDCRGYIPAIQLCVCHDKLGNRQKAVEYNELALSFKPQSEAALSNKKYFERKA